MANSTSKMPKMMKIFEDNFEGKKYAFHQGQIMRGQNKGWDELMKMTTEYLLQPRLLFPLLCNCNHGAPFLRAFHSP